MSNVVAFPGVYPLRLMPADELEALWVRFDEPEIEAAGHVIGGIWIEQVHAEMQRRGLETGI
jgi:hypothetical protein